MKILVTGGGGFLGSHIIHELLKNPSYLVSQFSRNHYTFLDDLGVPTIRGNLKIKDDVQRLFENQFDVVIHTAAVAGVWGKREDYFLTNFEATKDLLHFAKASGVKAFIYTSTPSVVFKNNDLNGVDESEPYATKFYNHYMESKSLAEKEVLSAHSEDFRTLALRPHLIWGKGDPHLFPRIIQTARQGKLKIVGRGDNLVDTIHVENAALAHRLAMETLITDMSIGGQAYFIGQERPVNLWSFINQALKNLEIDQVEDSISLKKAYAAGVMFETIFKALGINKPEPPMTRFVALNLAHSHYFNHEKAKRAFGYYPKVSIEEGVERTFKKINFSSGL